MQYISDKVYRNVSIYESFFSFLNGEDLSITTEALSKKDRSKMKDDEFAVPSIRKYPINNEESIKNGIKFFRFVPAEYRDECAKNLIAAAKKFKIEIAITKDNPLLKYYPDAKIIPRTRTTKKKED